MVKQVACWSFRSTPFTLKNVPVSPTDCYPVSHSSLTPATSSHGTVNRSVNHYDVTLIPEPPLEMRHGAQSSHSSTSSQSTLHWHWAHISQQHIRTSVCDAAPLCLVHGRPRAPALSLLTISASGPDSVIPPPIYHQLFYKTREVVNERKLYKSTNSCRRNV